MWPDPYEAALSVALRLSDFLSVRLVRTELDCARISE